MKPLLMMLVCIAVPLAAQPRVAAWDVLKKGLSETNPDKRKQAVLALASVGPAAEVIELLNEALRDKEVIVRQATAAAIGENKIRPCIPNLRAALDDSGEVAFTAAKALWEMGDRNSRKLIEDVYAGQTHKDPGVIEAALRDAKAKLRNPKTLALIGVHEASGALMGPFSMGITMAQEAMKDSGAPGRTLAISMLSQDCDARTLQLMEWSLKMDHNKLVKAATAKALGKCGDGDSVDKLIPLMVDDNVAVKYMAAAAIVRLGIEKGAGTKPVE